MRVLVTGGTGFVAGWCISGLLEQGHDVRTTVRNEASEAKLAAVFGSALTFARADLLSDDGWADAMNGIEAVLHVASPMQGADMMTPALDGTARVLRAAARAGVGRVVMTSSCAAATPPDGSKGAFDETLWTDPSIATIDDYRKSKLAAEQQAWKLAAELGLSLTTVLPGAVFGPLRSSDNQGSVRIIDRMLNGMPAVPRIGLNIVDVRDVADLHIRAMTAPEADGQRYIAVSELLSMSEVAAVIRDELGERGSKAPKKTIPDFLIRGLAKANPELRDLLPMLGRQYTYDNAKARSIGWQPRSARETVVDCAESLLANRS